MEGLKVTGFTFISRAMKGAFSATVLHTILLPVCTHRIHVDRWMHVFKLLVKGVFMDDTSFYSDTASSATVHTVLLPVGAGVFY